jgi:hypothetical protein
MAERKRQVLAKTKARSRLTNGHTLPRSVDQRTRWARRFRDLISLHTNDLGGPDVASAGEQAIIRRACTLITALEAMEETMALKGKADLDTLEVYQRSANSMRRLLLAVGLARRARPVPTLQDYLRNRELELEANESESVEGEAAE